MPVSTQNMPSFRPYSNIQPFTVRDGATYLLQLETLISWVSQDVIPHLDEETRELAESWHTASKAIIDQFNAVVEDIGDHVATVDAAKDAAEAARDLAELFASQAQEVQDASVTTIFNDASSLFREAVTVTIAGMLREDEDDPGTFVFNFPEPVAGNGEITADPNDPGFFH